jgi:hypothetical protein
MTDFLSSDKTVNEIFCFLDIIDLQGSLLKKNHSEASIRAIPEKKIGYQNAKRNGLQIIDNHSALD